MKGAVHFPATHPAELVLSSAIQQYHQSTSIHVSITMDDPIQDITPVVHRLTQGSPKEQEDAINEYFTTNASFTHPFCRTGSFEGSRWLIHAIFRWYKILSPTIKLNVNSVGQPIHPNPIIIDLTMLNSCSIRRDHPPPLRQYLPNLRRLVHTLLLSARHFDHPTPTRPQILRSQILHSIAKRPLPDRSIRQVLRTLGHRIDDCDSLAFLGDVLLRVRGVSWTAVYEIHAVESREEDPGGS